jgi:membrane AbrB-like protein
LSPRLRQLVVALAIGSVGGALFAYFRLPLAWMLGAMTATTLAALAGAPLHVPGKLRQAMLAILGVMLGSSFRPETFSQAGQWAWSLAGLVVYILVVGAIGYTYMRRVALYGEVDAYFTSMPGGLNEMTALGHAMGGDERLISLSHAVRLTLVVLAIPFWFRYVEGYPSATPFAASAGLAPLDVAILVVCGVAGPFVGNAVRLPAAHLTGTMALSAAAHLGGLTQSSIPPELVIVAQVVLGTALGARFTGIPLRRIAGLIVLALGMAVMMLACTVFLALVVHSVSGLAVDALLLAYAPGGFAEMGLVALSLGVDTAFVATHQLLRILIVLFLAPTFFRFLAGRVNVRR